MGEHLRIGFLGAGLIATYHSKSLRHGGSPVERAGVFDPDERRAAAFAEASGHTPMSSEDDVIDSCDAVYVCTWTSEHFRQVSKAAARGRAIFCEKPLAFDAASAEQMTAMVLAAGVVNQVGLVLRHSPVFCERRTITIEGDDWYGPVSWSNTGGDSHTVAGDELSAAVAPMREGPDNPDAQFVQAVIGGTPAMPDFADAVHAHRIIDAMYASAKRSGSPVEVGRG